MTRDHKIRIAVSPFNNKPKKRAEMIMLYLKHPDRMDEELKSRIWQSNPRGYKRG
jgi:hypothetical protein